MVALLFLVLMVWFSCYLNLFHLVFPPVNRFSKEILS